MFIGYNLELRDQMSSKLLKSGEDQYDHLMLLPASFVQKQPELDARQLPGFKSAKMLSFWRT